MVCTYHVTLGATDLQGICLLISGASEPPFILSLVLGSCIYHASGFQFPLNLSDPIGTKPPSSLAIELQSLQEEDSTYR